MIKNLSNIVMFSTSISIYIGTIIIFEIICKIVKSKKVISKYISLLINLRFLFVFVPCYKTIYSFVKTLVHAVQNMLYPLIIIVLYSIRD